MKSPLVLYCAVGLVGAAGTWVWRQPLSLAKPSSADSLAPPTARPRAVRAPTTGASRPTPVAAGTLPETAEPSPRANFSPAASPPRAQGPAGLGETELQRRAARVEQEANHDLAQLVGLLGLDEAQQDRIFETLVRHSPQWLPAMQPVGAAGASGSLSPGSGSVALGAEAPAVGGSLLDAIAADLTPDQQVELANEELDRQEWWESIIAQLLPDSAMPAVEGAGPAVEPSAPPGASGPADSKAAEEPAVLD